MLFSGVVQKMAESATYFFSLGWMQQHALQQTDFGVFNWPARSSFTDAAILIALDARSLATSTVAVILCKMIYPRHEADATVH